MSNFKEVLETNFNSWGSYVTPPELIDKILGDFKDKDISRDNSRLVFSVCPDDVNRLTTRETIEASLKEKFDNEFHLGGLGAYPIGGVSGITAASHHPPDDISSGDRKEGNLIFFVSPHVGILEKDSMKLGKMVRPGQEKITSSCGAMMGFLAALKEAGSASDFNIAADDKNVDPTRIVLQEQLINKFSSQLDEILGINDSNKQVADLFKLNYDLVANKAKEMIKEFMAKEHFEGKIAFIGGITVNLPGKDTFLLKEISYPKA
ncbi:hypothetical protein GF325_13915 [Candidatus Bathyarchaeota archaeon]|nr:hypothetical protein [Candidatus Bathyarchaeota archaeon]